MRSRFLSVSIVVLVCACASAPSPKPAAEAAKASATSRQAPPQEQDAIVLEAQPENPFAQSDPMSLLPQEKEPLFEAPLPGAPEPDKTKMAAETAKPAVVAHATPAEKKPAPPAPEKKVEAPKPAKKAEPAAASKPAAAPKETAPKPATPQEIAAAQAASLPAQKPPAASEEKPQFSRTVKLLAGQLLEIPYRGNGWIFIGEQNARKGLPYDSRRLDKDGQSFMFRAEVPGEYALKFYRQDFINDYIVNDYVKVTVEAAPVSSTIGAFSTPVDRGRIIADPRWPPVPSPATAAKTGGASQTGVPPIPAVPAAPRVNLPGSTAAPAQTAPAQPAPSQLDAAATAAPTVTSPSPAAPTAAIAGIPAASAPPGPAGSAGAPAPGAAPASPPLDVATIPASTPQEEYAALAKKEAAAGRVASALAVLDRSLQVYPQGSDEIWWQFGQLYEANSPAKNVKQAHSSYKFLVDNYPLSSRYDDAAKRIAYLERYYFEIR